MRNAERAATASDPSSGGNMGSACWALGEGTDRPGRGFQTLSGLPWPVFATDSAHVGRGGYRRGKDLGI